MAVVGSPSSSSSSTRSSSSGNPWVSIGVGGFFLLVWIAIIFLEMQITEDWSMGQILSLNPDWSIFAQPYDFVTGHLPGQLVKAFFSALIVESIYVACFVGFERAHYAVKKTNKRLLWLFVAGSIFIGIFNIYTNYTSGPMPSGDKGQALFAGCMFFGVMFLGPISVHYLKEGIGELRHP